MAFYRFARACRQVLVNFLSAYLDQEQMHWDGTDWIELPPIHVVDAREYSERILPSVVTDSAAGSMQTLSFSQVIGVWKDDYGIYGPRDTSYQVYGGRGNYDISIVCAANDRDLQQRLTDVATVYLTVGRGWVYNNRHVLLRDVRLQGDGLDDRVPEEPVYYATLSVPATADWRILVEGETLARLNFDVELVTPDDPFEDPIAHPPGTLTPIDKNPLVAVFDKEQMTNMHRTLHGQPQSEIPDSEDLPIKPMKTPYGRN